MSGSNRRLTLSSNATLWTTSLRVSSSLHPLLSSRPPCSPIWAVAMRSLWAVSVQVSLVTSSPRLETSRALVVASWEVDPPTSQCLVVVLATGEMISDPLMAQVDPDEM